MGKYKDNNSDPIFTRGEVCNILQVSALTISNREKSGKYPEPDRDINNYRIYSLNDVLNLQLITHGKIDTRPIISVLYDKGFKDTKRLGMLMERALNRKKGR